MTKTEDFAHVQPDDDIIAYRQFDSVIDANIAKTKLDANDIPCFLTGENMSNLYPGQQFMPIRVQLHLFKKDQQAADSILNTNLHLDNEGVFCPKCHSSRVIRKFPKSVEDSLTYLLFGIFLHQSKVNFCAECDLEF